MSRMVCSGQPSARRLAIKRSGSVLSMAAQGVAGREAAERTWAGRRVSFPAGWPTSLRGTRLIRD